MSKSDACCNISTSTATGTTRKSENTATNDIDNSITHQGKDSIVPVSTTNDSDDCTAPSLIVNDHSASWEPLQDTGSTTPPLASSTNDSDRTAPSLIVNDHSASREPLQDTGSTAQTMTTVAFTTNNSDMDDDAPALGTDETSNSVPRESGQEETANVGAPASATDEPSNSVPRESGQEEIANIVAVSAPGWLNTLNMDIYLQGCSDTKEWQELVQSLYKFEEGNTINGVCYYNLTTVFLTIFLP